MIFEWLEHSTHVSWVFQSAIAASLLLFAAGYAVKRKAESADGGVIPDEGVSVRNLVEVVVEGLADLARDRMGPEWRTYFPLVGTIFFFILVSNLMGMIPGFAGATSSAGTTWAWAIIAWVFYTYIGLKKHGAKTYLIKFMGPSFFEREIGGKTIHFRLLAPVFMVLEIPLDMARIATLSIRLLANMFADHTVIAVWLKMVPIGIPAIFFGLGLIVSILQAFIFSLLTMIYIGLALDEPH